MFSWEDGMTYMTGMDENGIAEQGLQNTDDTLVMGQGVEKPEFLDINVETSEGLGSVLFADENAFSTDTRIEVGAGFKEFMLRCDTEHLPTEFKHGFYGEQPAEEEVSVLVAVLEKSITVPD